jgi:8-oxo-dGTP pyrophosphatase MutT (NUDIX family)
VSARSEAWTTLRDWSAPAGRQADLRDSFVAHLEAHPDGLDRSCAAGHLTAGALVLSPGLDAVLLNLHGKARRWFHFGGHHEAGDGSLLGTATREAAEESGIVGLELDPVPIHLDRHTVRFCRPHGSVDHLDVRYAALAPAGAEGVVSEESLDVRWWPLGGLPDVEPEMHELIALARERLAQPIVLSAGSSAVSTAGSPTESTAEPAAGTSPSSRAPAE